MQVSVLSGGAAQGLLEALADEFKRRDGLCHRRQLWRRRRHARETAGGRPGRSFDPHLGHDRRSRPPRSPVRGGLSKDIGIVRTALAAPAGDPVPKVDTPAALARALGAATSLYFPDPQRATAGIHFAKVLAELGIGGPALAEKAQIHANGTAAHARPGAGRRPWRAGLYPGHGNLEHAGREADGAAAGGVRLATVYTIGVSAAAPAPGPARALAALLTAPGSEGLRARLGFEPL